MLKTKLVSLSSTNKNKYRSSTAAPIHKIKNKSKYSYLKRNYLGRYPVQGALFQPSHSTRF